jgi:hypothetical protein
MQSAAQRYAVQQQYNSGTVAAAAAVAAAVAAVADVARTAFNQLFDVHSSSSRHFQPAKTQAFQGPQHIHQSSRQHMVVVAVVAPQPISIDMYETPKRVRSRAVLYLNYTHKVHWF